jgi:hypothetical protein
MTLYDLLQTLPAPPYPSSYAEAADRPGTLLWVSQMPLLGALYEQHADKLGELGFEVIQKPFTELLVHTGEIRFVHQVHRDEDTTATG